MIERPLKMLGVYAGIGSPFVYAHRAGHKLYGNIEPRGFCHHFDENGRNTFLENFPGAWLVKSDSELPDFIKKDLVGKVDVIGGHPKCGRYSNLVNKTGAERKEYASKASDEFLEWIRIVNVIKPKFAFFDNLPKSLEANPPELYKSLLPDYHIDVEYVSNYHYGNSQKNRNRLFIIASLHDLGYQFMPGERNIGKSLKEVIRDLEDCHGRLPNHILHSIHSSARAGNRVFRDGPMNWGEVQKIFRDKKDNKPLHYINDRGEQKFHFGFRKPKYDGPSPTLIGTNPIIHPVTNLPTTIRERARIMGFPDDFIFYSEKLEDDGTWRHNMNGTLIRQTGRCIPCEFPGFLIDQFHAFLTERPRYRPSCVRLAKQNKIVQRHLGR